MKFRIIALALLMVTTYSCSEYTKLLESEDYEAQYQAGLGYYEEGKTSKALTLLYGVERIFSGTDKIDTIKFYIANSHFKRTEYVQSAELYDKFRKEYQRSPFKEEAEYLYAMSYFYSTPNSELDQTNATAAIAAFEEFLYRYPESDKAEECRSHIADLTTRIHKKDYYVGETYYKIGYHQSAVTTLKNILKRNPDTPLREDILFLILKSQYSYAKESVAAKQKERFIDVIDAYYSLMGQYPESKYTKIAGKLFENAEAITKGKATISDDSYAIVRLHDKEYRKKDAIETRMLNEDRKGAKKNMKKLVKLKEKLDVVNAEIERLESSSKEQEAK